MGGHSGIAGFHIMDICVDLFYSCRRLVDTSPPGRSCTRLSDPGFTGRRRSTCDVLVSTRVDTTLTFSHSNLTPKLADHHRHVINLHNLASKPITTVVYSSPYLQPL